MYQVSFTHNKAIYKLVLKSDSLQDALIKIRRYLDRVDGLVIVQVSYE
jgi:hypothetical protein